jgi:hypothetical protein
MQAVLLHPSSNPKTMERGKYVIPSILNPNFPMGHHNCNNFPCNNLDAKEYKDYCRSMVFFTSTRICAGENIEKNAQSNIFEERRHITKKKAVCWC